MSQLNLVAILSQPNYATFDELRLGRSTQQVVGRLLRFWDARNVKKNGEFMGIVFLLLDEKNSVIHCFIPALCATQFRHELQEGAIFNLGTFEVGRCTNLYKITDHPFVIRFLPTTTIVELPDAAPTIHKEKFMLRKINHLQALANTNLELPDVVGQIRFVQGSHLDDATSKQRLVVRFLLDTSVTVYLSLWDDAAATFRAHLSSSGTMHSVMIVTTVNPKLFGGNLYLNSTPATRFFFDTTIHAIAQFTRSLGIDAIEPFARAETAAGVQKKEVVTIEELYTYLSQTNEQTQEADFLCKASVVGVLQRNGWSYVSCGGCSRKLDKRGTSLRCTTCVSQTATGILRYRVELAVHDGQHPATFVVFDSEMTKLTNKSAATLALEEGEGTNGHGLPNCLQALAGKQFVFQIRVTPFNFTSNHRTFTVSRISAASTIEDGSEDEKDSPTLTTENNSEGPTTTHTVVVDTTQLEMNSDPPTSSTVGALSQKAKNRKRLRE